MTDFDKMECKKLARARFYIDKLSEGINPFDGSVIDGDSVLNDIRLKNCFNYIYGVLEIHEEALSYLSDEPEPRRKKKPFELSERAIINIPVTQDFINVTGFVNNINTLIDKSTTKN